MLNKISLIIGIIFIIYPCIYFIINNTTSITGYEILGTSGMIEYNGKRVASDYEYEKNIYQSKDGKWYYKGDIYPYEYIDPSNIIVRNTAKVLGWFTILPLLTPIIFLVGVIFVILSLCGVI